MRARQTTTDERYAMLRALDWAHGFSDDDLRVLADAATVYDAPAGDRLVGEGSTDRWMGLVVSGELEVLQSQVAMDERIIRVMGAGRVFGEVSMLDAEARSASVVALQAVVLLRFEQETLTRLSETHPAVAYRFVLRLGRDLARRLRSKEARLGM